MKTFEIRVYAPTDSKGLRIKIVGLSPKVYGFDYIFNSPKDMAINIIESNGYEIKDLFARTKGSRFSKNTEYIITVN
jgi:hypothetical protein